VNPTPFLLLAGIAAHVAGCDRGNDAPAVSDSAVAALAERAQPVGRVLRVARRGGEARLYSAPSLEEDWIGPELPAPDSTAGLAGADAEQGRVYYTDRRRALVSADLDARQVRRPVAGVRRAAVGPDGTVYAVDTAGGVLALVRRSPVRYTGRLPGRVSALYGRLGGGLLATVEGDSTGLAVFGPGKPMEFVALPGGPATGTYWGDLVAVGTDSAIVLFQPGVKERFRTLDVPGPVRTLAFSPSGHRLYVARPGARELLVVDRYGGAVLARVALPAPAGALRTDRYGDWLLVRAAEGDSVWAVDVARQRVVGGVRSAWGDDLPAVVAPATLIARRGADVVAHDLAREGLPEAGRVEGGARDFWLPLRWSPFDEEGLPTLADAEGMGHTEGAPQAPTPSSDDADADAPEAREDRARAEAADTTASGEVAPSAEPTRVYLQVSSSQNPEYARGLVRQLRQAGLDAGLLAPREEGDPYRVVVGPYEGRAQAEEASRRLNRPSFIVPAQPGDTLER
jgi:hypothetical protein